MKVKKEHISLKNYESILMDYLDGKLTADEIQQVHLFLLQHPDIQEDFSLLTEAEAVPVSAVQLPDSLKISLKKPEVLEAGEISWPDELSIKVLEKDASQEEISTFNQLKQENEAFKKRAGSFQRLRLQPDASIVFEPKSGLKRYSLVPLSKVAVMRLTSIAATLAVLLFAADIFFDYQPAERQAALEQSGPVNPTNPASAEKKPDTDYLANHQVPTTASISHPTKKEESPRNSYHSEKLQNLSAVKNNPIPVLENNREAIAGILPAASPALAYFAGDIQTAEEPVSLKTYLISRFKKDVLGEPVELTENPNLRVYEIADAGLGQLSKISNNRFSWKGERDENGSLVTYSFKTPFFEISKGKE